MPWINHLPPVCWSTFGILVWNDSRYVNLTQWWYFFIIFEYILHISTPHIMIFCFPLPYFPLSQQVLYFLLGTLVLTLYIDVVLSLSILYKYKNPPGSICGLFCRQEYYFCFVISCITIPYICHEHLTMFTNSLHARHYSEFITISNMVPFINMPLSGDQSSGYLVKQNHLL